MQGFRHNTKTYTRANRQGQGVDLIVTCSECENEILLIFGWQEVDRLLRYGQVPQGMTVDPARGGWVGTARCPKEDCWTGDHNRTVMTYVVRPVDFEQYYKAHLMTRGQ